MNEKLNEIYKKFHSENSVLEPKAVLEEYESIKGQFEKDSFEDYDEYFKTTKLVSDYAIAFVIDKQSDKSFPYFEKAISLINQNEKLKNKNLFAEPLYESLIFHRGIAHYDLKNFRKAFIDFNKLVDNFPENEKYNNWKITSKIYFLVKLEKVSLALLFISLLLSFPIKSEIRIINEIALVCLIIFLIGASVIGILNRKLKKSVKYTP